ncbi:MAG: S8 family peptidase [Minisyncoccia bacterium]
MKQIKRFIYILPLVVLIPNFTFANTDNRIVYTKCDIDSYEEQLADNFYLVDTVDVNQDCVVQSVQDKKIQLASNDTEYASQWSLKNTGQSILGQVGIPGIDIDFTNAYPKLANIPQGNTKVAVIDTGVTVIPEISGKVMAGYNFINNSNNANDDNGHGTFISSIIASKVNNSVGISGVNDKVNILPVKVLDSSGNGYLSDLIKGIQYAIDQNVSIINLSLASTSFDSILNNIIESAYQRGIIVVAAAGNSGISITSPNVSPLNNDGNKNWVIGVGAIDNRGNRPSYSNYGLGIDVVAPGDKILGYNNVNNSEYRSGTSMAAAIVTGVLSAWRDYYGSLNTDEAHNLIKVSSKSGGLISMDNAMNRTNYPNGSLIRTANSGVYLIKQGVKRPIIDPSIFLSYYYKWQDIVVVSDFSLNSIPTGDALPLREGALIADRDKVYVIEQGMKRPIASPEVFLGLGYKWGNISTPSDYVLNLHPTGSIVSDINEIPNGSVVFSEGTGAYLIENGTKRPFSNPYTYLSRYNWNDLLQIRKGLLDSFSTSTEVYPQEGSIIRDDGAVYWVENNTKRPFASPQAFLGLGLSWGRVVYPPMAVLNGLTRGDIIQ